MLALSRGKRPGDVVDELEREERVSEEIISSLGRRRLSVCPETDVSSGLRRDGKDFGRGYVPKGVKFQVKGGDHLDIHSGVSNMVCGKRPRSTPDVVVHWVKMDVQRCY